MLAARCGPADVWGRPAGDDGTQIQAELSRIVDFALARDAEKILGAEISLEELTGLVAATGIAHVGDGVSSTGKKPIVAPYSGAMLAIVARSVTVRLAVPSPKNSTNVPTTFSRRSISVTASTRSVAVIPSASRPVSSTPMTSGVSRKTGCPSIAASASMPPTPADDSDTVDHGGMGVRSDQGVWKQQPPFERMP